MDLKQWLASIDLEMYYDAFVSQGATKVEHMKDVDTDILDEINMVKNLERRRFLNNQKLLLKGDDETPSTSSVCPTREKSTIHLPCPDLIGGRKTLAVDSTHLITEYGVLYYKTPTGFKQTESNKFILSMLTSARWNYKNKKDVLIWGREERRQRIEVLINLSAVSDMKGESKYFREQSILCQEQNLDKEYSDVFRLLQADTIGQYKGKHARVQEAVLDLNQLCGFAETVRERAREKYQIVTGSIGHKEEEDFWKSLLAKAYKVEEVVTIKRNAVTELLDKFTALFGESRFQKSASRKNKVNIKRKEKRKKKSPEESVAKFCKQNPPDVPNTEDDTLGHDVTNTTDTDLTDYTVQVLNDATDDTVQDVNDVISDTVQDVYDFPNESAMDLTDVTNDDVQDSNDVTNDNVQDANDISDETIMDTTSVNTDEDAANNNVSMVAKDILVCDIPLPMAPPMASS